LAVQNDELAQELPELRDEVGLGGLERLAQVGVENIFYGTRLIHAKLVRSLY